MTNLKLVAKSILSICLASSCTLSYGRSANDGLYEDTQFGVASYYSDKYQGRRTANGERYDKNGLTTVHQRLPFGTRVRVTNLRNHKSVIVKVNDRMDPRNRRLLDLSKRAAKELAFLQAGLARVKMEVVY
jgi:rare lipoprotein A